MTYRAARGGRAGRRAAYKRALEEAKVRGEAQRRAKALAQEWFDQLERQGGEERQERIGDRRHIILRPASKATPERIRGRAWETSQTFDGAAPVEIAIVTFRRVEMALDVGRTRFTWYTWEPET